MIAVHDESLWRTYREQLFRFVQRRVEDHATAEDIVHDVLVRAYQKRDTLRGGQKFEPWLYQIARNAVIDHYRARRPTEELPADLAEAEGERSDAARRELAECIHPLVDALPEHYRDAVRLSELHGLTQQETARRLGLSLSGAKSRVQRARRRLEEMLLACCRVEFDGRGAIVDYESPDGCGPGRGGAEDGCGSCGGA
ncbi:RNA polymerase sigma factor SigZ [Longimicrobium sp.]|jgi:RNA polymerase sigma-70 factor (ECF subfamily)|uniref:RNA polymerase sigma factor SigZ n=1 Tax=Longimicrobium sp. TaxID=2029185 RepID=UPI002ED90139